MVHADSPYRAQAATYWANGQALEAGKLIYENLAPSCRPAWASRILQVVLDRSGNRCPIFEQVLVAAAHPDMWKHAHGLFSNLRQLTLKLDELRQERGLSEKENLRAAILSLAEFTAKVVYNATGPEDEFDEDSGWWMAVWLRYFVDKVWNDKEFARAAWLALSFSE